MNFTPEFNMKNANSLNHALDVLYENNINWIPFAGGTDLMVMKAKGFSQNKNFLNILDIPELKGITLHDNHIEIGALTTFSEIKENKIILNEFPLLFNSARQIGSWAIQNRATIGGNIINASPAADSPPALLCYDADLEIISKTSTKFIPITEFYLGYKKIKLSKGDLLKSIRIKRNTCKEISLYRKVGTRQAQAISKICFAAKVKKNGNIISDIALSIGSVAPTPIRCTNCENTILGNKINQQLINRAKEQLLSDIHPIDDIRSTKEYRIIVSLNILEYFLKNL